MGSPAVASWARLRSRVIGLPPVTVIGSLRSRHGLPAVASWARLPARRHNHPYTHTTRHWLACRLSVTITHPLIHPSHPPSGAPSARHWARGRKRQKPHPCPPSPLTPGHPTHGAAHSGHRVAVSGTARPVTHPFSSRHIDKTPALLYLVGAPALSLHPNQGAP